MKVQEIASTKKKKNRDILFINKSKCSSVASLVANKQLN